MNNLEFLDANGLSRYHKAAVEKKVDKIAGKGLSSNDLTDALKDNYDSAYSHSLDAHAPIDAEKNQNAFAEISLEDKSIKAENPADLLRLKGQGNIVITLDPSDKSVAINTTGFSAVATTGSYNDLADKPTIPEALPNPHALIINGVSYDGSEAKEITIEASNDGILEESDPTVPDWAKAENKPTYTADEVGALPNTTVIPQALADLTDDATHRLVTDTEKISWNNKSNFSGSYNDLTNVPEKFNPAEHEHPYIPTSEKGSTNGIATLDSNGHIPTAQLQINATDIGLEQVVNTGDSDVPTQGGTTKFTTGGAYTELFKKVDKIEGKGLSTNDYTNADKYKLNSLVQASPISDEILNSIINGTYVQNNKLYTPFIGLVEGDYEEEVE